MLAHLQNYLVVKYFMDVIMKKVIKYNKIKNKSLRSYKIGYIYVK
jgi:hypothetical protein